jgi:hypothetical protein
MPSSTSPVRRNGDATLDLIGRCIAATNLDDLDLWYQAFGHQSLPSQEILSQRQ